MVADPPPAPPAAGRHPVCHRPTHRGADPLGLPGSMVDGMAPIPELERSRRRHPDVLTAVVRPAALADAGRGPPAGRARAGTVRRACAALDS
jgi:hypothetical protein